MPPLPAVNKVVKCVMETPVTAHPTTQSRIYIAYAGTAPTVTQLNTFAAAIGTAWGTNLKAFFSTNTSLSFVQCEDLSAGGLTGAANPAVAGTRAGTEVPIQCAAEITFAIARRYRGGKPKVFLNAGVQADFADVRSWTAGFQSGLLSGWQAFIAGVLGSGWASSGALTHVSVSYYSGFTTVTRLPFRARNVPTLRGTPLQDTIQSYSAPIEVASQRRRRN